MSIQHMSLVLEAADLCAQEKAVLLAVCNHTDATGKIWASEQRLMREAGMPRTTFQRWRAKLVERQLLISQERRTAQNQRLTSFTWVNLPALRTMRDPFFARPGRDADEEDANPFDVSAGQGQAPSVEPGEASQAPPVGEPGPASGAYPGPASGAVNPPLNPPSSIARADEAGLDSVAGDQTATDDDARTTGMNPDQFHELVCAVIEIRPEWQTPGIRAQVSQVAHLPYDVVYDAFVAAASDRKFYTPMHLATAAESLHNSNREREHAAGRRERLNEEWRREVHEDHENRADFSTAKSRVAQMKNDLRAKRGVPKDEPAGV